MGGACGTYGRWENTYRGKVGKQLVGGAGGKSKCNVNVDLKKLVKFVGLCRFGVGKGQVLDCLGKGQVLGCL